MKRGAKRYPEKKKEEKEKEKEGDKTKRLVGFSGIQRFPVLFSFSSSPLDVTQLKTDC